MSKREIVLIAMMRTKDLPEPYVKSEKKDCERCGEPCWTSHPALTLKVPLKYLCTRCIKQVATPGMGGGS